MKFNFSGKKPNVRRFVVFNGLLFYIIHKEIRLFGAPENIFLDGATVSDELILVDHILVWSDGRGHLIAYDINISQVVFENRSKYSECYLFYINMLVNNSLLIERNESEELKKYRFDLDRQLLLEIKKEIRLVGISKDKEVYFTWARGPDENLCRIDDLGNDIWQYEISGEYLEYGVTKRDRFLSTMLGTYDGAIWFVVGDTELIGVDIDSGKEVFNLEAVTQLILDKDRGELIGLHFECFFRVDLKFPSPILEKNNLTKHMHQVEMRADFSPSLIYIENDLIYFCDGGRGKIGVFNRDTKTVIHTCQLDIPQGGIHLIKEIKIDGNKCYVHDGYENLHVLELVR